MPTQQVDNPAGAFQPLGATNQAPPGKPGQDYVDVYNSGTTTINVNEWVQLDITGTSGHVYGVTQGLHGGTIGAGIGIAIDSIAAGAYGRVCTGGPKDAIAGAAGVVEGQFVIPSSTSGDDGQCVSSATGTAGKNLGLCLVTQATQGGTFSMWVAKT